MSEDSNTTQDKQLDQSAEAPHPRQPGEGPQTEKQAREAGEAPSDVNNEGAQNQGQVSQLKDNEKADEITPADPDAERPESSSDVPQEGTKPNREMDTESAEKLDEGKEADTEDKRQRPSGVQGSHNAQQ